MNNIIDSSHIPDAIKIETEDFKKALNRWFWYLDECCDNNNPEFNSVLKKYNLTLDDIL